MPDESELLWSRPTSESGQLCQRGYLHKVILSYFNYAVKKTDVIADTAGMVRNVSIACSSAALLSFTKDK